MSTNSTAIDRESYSYAGRGCVPDGVSLEMSPAEYRDAILRLGLSQNGAAEFFGRSGRQGQRWTRGWSPLPKSVAMLLQLMLRYGLRPKDLTSDTVRHHGAKDWINGDGISAI